MTEAFKPFDAALLVRDALLSCSCCADEAEGQERYSASHDLLEWVVQAQAEIAGLRALTNGAAPTRAPLSDAERAKAYRARKRVTKTVTERHENRHAAVTQSVTESPSAPPSRALPSDLPNAENLSDSLDAQKEEKHASMLSERVTKNVTTNVTLAVTHEVVSREWHAAMATAGAAGLHAAHAWRADYETVAAACADVDGDPLTAVVAVCRWFWLAPEGPVQAGRVRMHFATPGHLSKRVSTDLIAAAAWWATQQEAAQ